MKTLTLLTDFGTQDAYVAVMKGVIKTIAPTVSLIDITHDIPAQDLMRARFQWMSAYPYFPSGTIHLAVVDPGVGSRRRSIALQLPSGYVIAPDNGIVSGIFDIETPRAAVELNNPQYWLKPNPSKTFHGRDIFAPAAAHLANGVSLHKLGRPINWQTLVQLPLPAVKQIQASQWQGCIQAIDHFGNLITNLRGDLLLRDDLVAGHRWSIQLGEQSIPGQTTYANVQHHAAVGLIGSENWIEIAIRNGSAQAYFESADRRYR